MPYGILKIDTITFTDGGIDKSVTDSGLVLNPTFTGNVTVTGTISGNIIQGGTTANFASGVFTTQVSGLLITGPTVSATTGTFTSLTGTTTTGTTANFASGVFTTQISGVTITGTTVSTTTGNFTSLTGTTATITSGIIASGTAALPSLAILSDPNTGIYSPGADQLAVATNGTGRLFVDASGRVGIGTSSQEQRLTVLDNSTSVASGSTLTVNGGTFNTGGEGGSIAFSNTVKTGITHAARIRSGLVFLDVQETGNLIFDTNGGAGLTERLRITSAGLVGIGTSSPGALLDVREQANAVSQQIRLTNTNTVGTVGSAIKFQGFYDTALISSDGVPGATTGGSLRLQTYSSNGVLNTGINVDRLGNVGIGTTSPAYALDVASSVAQVGNSTDAFIQYKSTAGNWHVGANSSNAYVFYSGTYGSGNERARIDASGRLLVGTSTSVSNALEGGVQIVGTAADAYLTITRFGGAAASAPAGIILGRSRSGTKGTNTAVADGDFLGVVEFTGADGGSSYRSAAQIAAYVDGAVSGGGAADMPGRLVFSTTADGTSSPTERMRIDSSGYVSINATQNFPGDGNTGTGIFFERAADGGTIFGSRAGGKSGSFNRNEDGEVVRFNRSGVDVGSIDVTTSATSYNTSSDYRLKENIVLLTGATDRLNQLQVHRFNFIADSGATVDGFIAHEAQAVVPECVTGTKDEVDEDGNPVYQGIDQSKLVPLVTAALQEAIAKIETLEQRLTAAGID